MFIVEMIDKEENLHSLEFRDQRTAREYYTKMFLSNPEIESIVLYEIDSNDKIVNLIKVYEKD